MDGFEKQNLSEKEREILDKVQSEIAYCAYCQPYDGGEVVWIFGDQIDLDDLFSDYEISEDEIYRIKTHLHCPHCGHDDLSADYEIGIKTSYENQLDSKMIEVADLHGTEIQSLLQFIKKNPFLAYKNPLAQKIFKEIEENKFSVTKIKGSFFRARKVQNANVMGIEELHCPPEGISTEGRFNHSGQSHLYLSTDYETSINEISDDYSSQLVWYQEFEILKEVDNILDLSMSDYRIPLSKSVLMLALTEYRDSVYKESGNINNWKPDYFLTRFIMDCAKLCGYNGIKYNSTKNELEYNIVLFYPKNIIINPIERPKIFIFMKKEENNIFDESSISV